jgi:hypothetical protein
MRWWRPAAARSTRARTGCCVRPAWRRPRCCSMCARPPPSSAAARCSPPVRRRPFSRCTARCLSTASARSRSWMAHGRLLGMPTIQEMAQLFLPSEARAQRRQPRGAHQHAQHGRRPRRHPLRRGQDGADTVEDLILVVAASSVETSRDRARQFPPRQVVLVTGDRPEIHALAIELGVRCLVVTGGFMPWDSLLSRRSKGRQRHHRPAGHRQRLPADPFLTPHRRGLTMTSCPSAHAHRCVRSSMPCRTPTSRCFP